MFKLDRDLQYKVANRIRFFAALRRYHSEELFAHECGIDKGTMSRILNTKTTPSLASLIRIVENLEITINDLYLETDLVIKEGATEYDAHSGDDWIKIKEEKLLKQQRTKREYNA